MTFVLELYREAEAGGSLWVQGQHGLLNWFQNSQEYKEKSCLKKKQNIKQKIYVMYFNTLLPNKQNYFRCKKSALILNLNLWEKSKLSFSRKTSATKMNEQHVCANSEGHNFKHFEVQQLS